jgi:tellurite resistance protein TerC
MRSGVRRYATPLLIVLVAVETTDLIFALDSIPAIFAVTTDPFLVFTSNIFAILGLRSLYFVLAGLLHKFRYLKPGVAIVLLFVGLKMLLSKPIHIPVEISLAVIVSILTISVLASVFIPQRKPPEGTGAAPSDDNENSDEKKARSRPTGDKRLDEGETDKEERLVV